MVVSMAVDRLASLEWFRRNRRRSAQIFSSLRPEAYYDRPIPLRNPICFYEGHLPAFGVNTLVKRGLGEDGDRPRLERLFERGIDPEDESSVPGSASGGWPRGRRSAPTPPRPTGGSPGRSKARISNATTTRCCGGASGSSRCSSTSRCTRRRSPTCGTAFPTRRRSARRAPPLPCPAGSRPLPRPCGSPRGGPRSGAERESIPFGWDNEFPRQVVAVPAFEIDVHDVTNRDFLEFVEAGGYAKRAALGARRIGAGARRIGSSTRSSGSARTATGSGAGCGSGSRFRRRGRSTSLTPRPRPSPAGRASGFRPKPSSIGRPTGRRRVSSGATRGATTTPDATRGNFDFERSDPVPVGSYPTGASAWGVTTSSATAGSGPRPSSRRFPGFEPMPSYPVYSSDFFDGKHCVMKGASPATAKELLRPSLPQLVPRQLPVCLRDVSVREAVTSDPESAAARSRAELVSGVRRRRAARPVALAAAAPVEVPLRRASARRSSRRSAVCPGTGSRARRGACSRAGAGEMVSGLPDPVTLVELGCGSGEKIAMIVEALRKRQRPVAVHLIDISPAALEHSEKNLGGLEHVSVVGHRATYEEGLRRAAARSARPDRALLVLFLGSNIGNFDPPAARTGSSGRSGRPCVRATRCCSAPISSSRRRSCCSPTTIRSASRPPSTRTCCCGSTASCSPTSTSRAFDHRAVWNRSERRVEMHLVSRRAQEVVDPARRAATSRFAAGEIIWTESSYKYTPGEVHALGRRRRVPRPRAVDRARRPLRSDPLRRRVARHLLWPGGAGHGSVPRLCPNEEGS